MVLRIRYLEIEISVYGKILQGFQAISFIKNGPIPASFLFIFVLFSLQFQKYKLKKHRYCAWDSNPGPQDGRRRRSHGAMAATKKAIFGG